MGTILKLGGSVITDKNTPETVDKESLDEVCDVIARFLSEGFESESDSERADPQLVIVHGGGSFGHHHAAAYGLSSTVGTTDVEALTTVHKAMGVLNESVISACHDRDIPALPVHPLSVAHRNKSGLQFDTGSIEAMLSEGFVPVTHGDVVVDREKGGTILSGDDIVVSLAESLGTDRVGLCSTVPGVLDESDEVIGCIDSYSDVESVLGGSDATDVTGGMAHKVTQLLALDVPASIFDAASLEAFLASGQAGTVIREGEST